MTPADTRLSMAYWQQSPNCPDHYIKALDLYLEHKDIRMTGMNPKHFTVMAEKGVAKGRYMGLTPVEPPKAAKKKGRG